MSVLGCALLSCAEIADLGDAVYEDSAGNGGSSGIAAGGGSPEGGGAAGNGRGGDSGGTAGSGAAAGNGRGGADAGSAGTNTAGTGAMPAGCTDFTAQLCLQPPWPEAAVPYVLDGDLAESASEAIGLAIANWDSAPVGSTRLDFVEATLPGVPTLHFVPGSGCGVEALTPDEVLFATSSCRGVRHMVRELGVALGLPRMHQRSDRDEHLLLAPESAFSCERGEFLDVCPSRGELLAAFGPFSRSAVMYASGATDKLAEACVLEPDGGHLYLPRDPLQVGCPADDSDDTVLAMYQDHSALAELYASMRGWLPLQPLTVPDDGVPATHPGVLKSEPTLAATSNGNVVLFAWGASLGRIDLFATEHDGASWGEWKLALPLPSEPPLPVEFWDPERVLAAERAPGTFDVVAPRSGEIFHGSYGTDDDTWTKPNSQTFASPSALVASGGFLTLYASGTDDHLRVRGFDGESWTEWEQSVEYPEGAAYVPPAVVATGAVHHLALTSAAGSLFYRANDGQGWSPWIYLSEVLDGRPHAGVRDTAITAMPNGRLDIFVLTSESALLQLSCEAPKNCRNPRSWSEPALLFGNLWWDLVSLDAAASEDAIDVVIKASPTASLPLPYVLGHKRWRPIED